MTATTRIFIASATEWAIVASTLSDVLATQEDVDVDVLDWPAAFSPGRTPVLYHVLETMSRCDFGIFVLAPTDVTRMWNVARQETTETADETLTPRDNVLFELGLFIGLRDREHVYVVTAIMDLPSKDLPPLCLPSDFREQLPGSALSWRRVVNARSDPSGEEAQRQLKAAVGQVARDVLGRVRTLANRHEPPTPEGTGPTPPRAQRYESPWARRYRQLRADDLEIGAQILHPLLGIGKVLDKQTIDERPYVLASFADGDRRVPLSEPLYDPLSGPASPARE